MAVALIEYRILLNMVGGPTPTVPITSPFAPGDCVYLADGTRHTISCIVIANDTVTLTLDNGLVLDQSFVFTPAQWMLYKTDQAADAISDSLIKLQQLRDLLGI